MNGFGIIVFIEAENVHDGAKDKKFVGAIENGEQMCYHVAEINSFKGDDTMDMSLFMSRPGEAPLDRIVTDGGLCGIFRTMGCIGDSLSSGELESLDEQGVRGYHDYYEYSWGQYIARTAGIQVRNFSKGGMTAKKYCDSFAKERGFWDASLACQAYTLALGCNDINHIALGSTADIDPADYHNNAPTFAGYYGQIITRYKQLQPKARFFLLTLPHGFNGPSKDGLVSEVSQLIRDIAGLYEWTYVVDLERYLPPVDDEFRRCFFLGGHLNATGYLMASRVIASYIDYIIRNNPEDFAQVGFIGTPHHNCGAKW